MIHKFTVNLIYYHEIFNKIKYKWTCHLD